MMMMTLTRVQMKPEMSKLFAKVYMFNFSLRHPVSLLYTVSQIPIKVSQAWNTFKYNVRNCNHTIITVYIT